MTSAAVQRLISSIGRGAVLNQTTFESLDSVAALGGRDDRAFEAEWLRVHEALTALPLNPEAEEQVTRLCEAAFKRIYEVSEDPELAGEVSDDLDLVGRALTHHWNDPWLNGLLRTYLQHGFPHGSIEPVPGTIDDLIP